MKDNHFSEVIRVFHERIVKSVVNFAFYILVLSLIVGCATFNKDAKYNDISRGGQYIEINNSQAKFKSLSYGDFVYASDIKNYKRTYNHFGSIHNTPKGLLLYAITTEPKYYYYISENTATSVESTSDKSKTIHCQGKSLKMVVQGTAPKQDIAFLLDNFKCEE